MTAARESGTPRAPVTAALGASLTLTGLGFGLLAALVCGLALLLLAAGAMAWVELATIGGRLERDPGPGRLEESEPYPLRIVLRRTLLPPPGGELIDPLLDRSVQVGPRWSRRLERDVWVESPGRRRLAPARLVVRDPLGLWKRELDSGHAGELVILPRIDPVRWSDPGAERRGRRTAGSGAASDATSRRGGLAQFEVDGLRPYREGSPASRIHWPAVARSGEMIERRLIAGGEPRPLVVFDPRGGTATQRQRAMRAAASLCVELARSGGCELLVPGERRPLPVDLSLRGWPEAHVRIAVSDPHVGPSLPQGRSGAVVLWVTAGRSVRASLRRLRPGSFLITPSGPRRAALFRVSGCFAYPLAGPAGRTAPRRRAVA
ncbi:MAG: DUF58 domain-containing protein [Solirubrobacterales bacterium]